MLHTFGCQYTAINVKMNIPIASLDFYQMIKYIRYNSSSSYMVLVAVRVIMV